MSLTEDQRALMRLLLAGDTYEEVAEVVGTSPDQVREWAHTTAAALKSEPSPEFPTGAVEDRLRQLESGPSQAPASPPPRARPAIRPMALWLVAGGALAVLMVVLALTLLGGGGDDDADPLAPDQEEAVAVLLRAVGDSQADGTVTIIRFGDQLAVDLAIRGLSRNGPGDTYVLWFVGSGGRGLPIAFQSVGRDGEISGRTPIPNAASSVLPSFDAVELSLTSRRDAVAAIRTSANSGTLPERIGTTVLRGTLPG
jgi:hypothetical protein